MRRRWTRQIIIQELQNLQVQGADLSSNALKRRDNCLLQAARCHFPSYAAALKSAGLNHEKVRRLRQWNKTLVIKELRRWKKLGNDLSTIAMRRDYGSLYMAAKTHFASYASALEAAGIDYGKVRRHVFWARESILALIVEEHRNGEDMSQARVEDRHGLGLIGASKRFFGSYQRAAEAAGIEFEEIRLLDSWDKQKILASLLELHDAGEDLRSVTIRDKHLRLFAACKFYFGSYRDAFHAAGLPYPPKKPLRFWSKAKVIETLRALFSDGVDLDAENLKRTHQPLFDAAKYYFTKYHSALEAAGIDRRSTAGPDALEQP